MKSWQLDATVVERWYIESYMDAKIELLCIRMGGAFCPPHSQDVPRTFGDGKNQNSMGVIEETMLTLV